MKKLKKCIKSVISFSLAVVMLFSGISPLGIFAASASSFGVWQTGGNFTVTENGTYVIYAKDAVGNTTSIEITVNNIDYTPPALDVGYSTTEWTKDGVKLVLTSVDQASPGGTAGTVSLSVVGSDGTSYPTDYLFTSNTSGTVTSTDDVGNAVSKPFSITNVDTTVPKISISADITSPTNKDVTLKITGSDAESGLNAKPYSWDGKTWTDVATKAVSTNGVYTGYIRDAVGNISSTTISVANIDKVAPTISGYSYSTEAPCNTSVVVTVNATDTGLGLADSAYSFNGGAYGTSNKLTVTANGTYTVAVKDKAGNITNGSFKVSNLDFEAPVISSVVPSTTAETNKDVTLTINATDNVGGLGLADKAYRLQGYGDWQTSNIVTVTCNGTYTVEVKDRAGNIASKSIEITNIDKEPPTASHVLNITSPTNTDVVATLTILDNKGIKKVVTPDGTVVTQVSFQSITDYTFSKNGSYTFEIWDTADNKTTHTVDISNIDKDKPVIDSIERSTTKECNTYVDITVTAHDVGLGLEAKAFKFTGGDWQSANTLRVSKNGTYSISVRDVAGNVTTQEFSVLNLDFDKPVIKAMTLSTTSQTNKDLTLTVTAEDVGLGLAKSAYRINGGTWQESNVFTITENGTYTIEVIDKAGNIQTGTKTVTNIDKVAPKLSATVNTTDPTNQDVVVTLKASDDVEIFKVLDANGKSISLTKVSNEYTGTISESANGTFTYTAVDTAGNETTCTVKIANIDKSNPVIDSIGRSTTVPVNTQVVITINAHDVGLGLADKPYNFDGTGWVSDKTKVITANGNYRISVKDVAGNITTQTYNVMNLDFDAPKVNGVSLSTTSPTNKDVVLTINAEDVGLGLADKPYRFKNGTWQASPEFTVSQNGTYSFEIIDKAGNIASVSKEVTNIDKVAPTISAKVNTTDPTNKDIEVTLTANDNVGIAKVVNTSGVALTGTASGSNMIYVTKEPTNGTFTYTVTDTAGNTASVKVTIANVDKSAPVIDSIEKSTEAPVNTEVVVTVTAHDVGLGLSDTPYKLGDGSWVSSNKFTVTANGTYVISVLDKAGNTASKSFTISNLDFDAPVIKSVTQSTDAPTNKDVTLTVTAEDVGLGLATKAYRIDGGEWQTSNKFVVAKNGSYLIEVLDKAGNIGSYTKEVTNIDKVKPTITAVVNTEEPWNKDIVVTLTASDNVGIAKVVNTSGKVLEGNASNGKMVYTTSEAQNGTYTYTVTDTAGNTASVTVKIANIDKDKPVIDSIVKSTEVPVNSNVGITVTAHDVGLGLADKPFRFDGGEWSEIGETTITSNGTYVVEVMDKAGNIASKSYEVTNLDFDAPVVNKVTQSTDLPTNKDVVLTVDAKDIGLGLATKAYRMNGSEWQLSNKFTVSSNGDYTIEVLDMAGNIGNYVHKVTNIDKVAPKISVVSTNTNPTNQDVVLNVTATDNVGIAKVVNETGDKLPLVGGVFTYTVATNGTYKFTTYDTAGNTASASITVENIDKQNPVVDKITKSTEVPVNTSVTVSVTAHDVGLGLDVKPYSWDGTNWTDVNSTVIKSNGTYSVYVRDKSGNVISKEFEITNLDFDAPIVDFVMQSTDEQTNKDITITVNAHDIGLGLASKAYRLEGGVWQSSNKFTVSINGSYLIEVLDEAGNIGSYTHTVSNIDKELPGITISADKTEPVNTDVVLRITATDNVEVAKVVNKAGEELVGIGTASSKSYSYTVTGNGSYTFTVYDTAENLKKGTFKVENIDKSNPVLDKISKSTEDPINTNVVVTVTAHDIGLGLADKPYKFDNGDWTDVASTIITSNGTYTVQIKDKAGNVITESYEINNLDFISPVISSAKVLQTRPVKESARIAVQATDEGFGLADKAYKLNDGDWQTDNWFDVTDNGTYTVYVRDKAGNITSTTVEVTNIDRVKPEITYTVSTTEPTPALSIEVVGTDNMELGSVTCSDSRVVKGKTNWVSKTECRQIFLISQNGTYRFDTRDFVGNTNYVEVTIDNIDNVAPTIDKILKNPNVPTNTPLEITIIASDVGFGLADEPYRVDGSAWQSSNKFMIADNGVHRIDVRDKAGNTIMMTTDISNLDYDNPVIDEVTQDITEQTNTDVILTVTAHDVGLGLAKKPYKLGNGSWVSSNKFTVEENDDYVISVKDEAGNIETYTHTVSNIDKELPVASHTVDIDTPTSSDVVITFKATDNVEIKSITLPDKVVQDIGSNEAIIPFTVVKNGTYTFKVLDTAGNITTYPVKIDNIDKNPAEIVASPSVEGWTNQDIELNVVVTDDTLVRKVQSQGIWYDLDAGELPEEAVVEKGGQDRILKVKFSIPVSDNGTFEFKAIDFGGLETTYSCEVTTIDRVDPEIFAKVVNTDPTKDNVDITITTSDAYGEVSQIVLPGDNRIDGSETTYIATDNGEYKFTVIDKAGNSAEAVVKVGNIDRVAPTFTYELSPNEDGWSNDSVLLKVIGSDENGISAYKLFLGEEEIKALEGGVFQLFENGTYRIVVVDTVGNYSGTEITIGNIDKDEPTIAVGLKNKYWVNKSNTIVITGQDNSSGVLGYSLDGENWQESNEFKVSYKNSYTVYVKDLAGNVSSMTVYFDLVEEPIEDVEPLPEEEPKDNEDEDIVAPKSDLDDGSLIVIGELTDLPIEATEAEATESDVMKVVQKIAENVAEVAKVVFPYAAVLLLVTVGGLVFILLTDGVRVYGKNKKGKWQYLGIARCHKGVIGCTVKVKRSVLKKVDSADYLLKFNTRYSTINKGLELYIKVGNQAIISNVYKQVEFSVMK